MTTSLPFDPVLDDAPSPRAAPSIGSWIHPDGQPFRRLLVATDTTPVAEGALRVADVLATSTGAAVEVLTVVESPPASPFAPPPPPLVDQMERAIRHAHVQLLTTIGDRPQWSVTARLGSPAETISRLAEAHGADLIVVGRGRRRRSDRVLTTETALRVARRATVPMLSVPPTVRALPQRLLIATDFGPSCLRAARLALHLASRPARVHLVYVHEMQPPVGRMPPGSDALDAAFVRMERTLADEDGVEVSSASIAGGDVSSRLLEYAQAHDIELVAIGTQGRSFGHDTRLGGVAARLIRAVPCAVLVATPQPLQEPGP